MSRGLVNAEASYGRLMRMVLDVLDQVDNYVDDVLVYTDTWAEHLAIVRALFVLVRLCSF